MGSACGAYAVLPSSTRTKSLRDVARGFRPTQRQKPARASRCVVQTHRDARFSVAAAEEQLVQSFVPQRGDAVPGRADFTHERQGLGVEHRERAVAEVGSRARRVYPREEILAVGRKRNARLLVRRLQTVKRLDRVFEVAHVPDAQRPVRAPAE
jgi:hypothetical protein